jgi:hypothetical protein
MRRIHRVAAAVLFVIVGVQSISAQVPSALVGEGSKDGAVTSTAASTTSASIQDDSTYTLKKGDNEFGFWAGGSFAATTAFGGLTEAEASDRKFVIAAFRYGRTLAANDSMALQYTLDAIPLAVATGNITQVTTVGPVTTFRRETAYGGGLTPLGLQLDFANGSKVHPFIHVNGGGLIFNQSVPLPDAGRFAFVGEAGTGLRIFTSEREAVTLGFKFHHISNGDRAGSNRGLNQFVFYGGFSIFK